MSEKILWILLVVAIVVIVVLIQAWREERRQKSELQEGLRNSRRDLAAMLHSLKLKGLTDEELEVELHKRGFVDARDLLERVRADADSDEGSDPTG